MTAKNSPGYDSETRLALLEQTNGHIYEMLARIDKRFDRIDERFDALELKFEGRFDKLDAKIDSRFFWLLGIYIAGFGSLFGLIAKGLHWI